MILNSESVRMRTTSVPAGSIDYRATHIHGIGNGIMSAIVPHSNAPETLPLIRSTCIDLVKCHLSKKFV